MVSLDSSRMQLLVLNTCTLIAGVGGGGGGLGSRQSTPNGYGGREVSSPSQNDSDYKYGRFDASALHIAHALKQTEIQKAYNKAREKPIDFYLVRTLLPPSPPLL